MTWICKKIGFITIIFCNLAWGSTNLETFGDIGQKALPVIAVGETAFHKDFKGFTEFAYSYLLSTAIEQSLKQIIHRKRPNHGNHSFPSGHTTSGFVSASFLQLRYGSAYGVPAFVVATMIGYSRIPSKKHWPTDVLVGAAIGIGSSFIFTDHYLKKVEVIPYYHTENKEAGISATARL